MTPPLSRGPGYCGENACTISVISGRTFLSAWWHWSWQTGQPCGTCMHDSWTQVDTRCDLLALCKDSASSRALWWRQQPVQADSALQEAALAKGLEQLGRLQRQQPPKGSWCDHMCPLDCGSPRWLRSRTWVRRILGFNVQGKVCTEPSCKPSWSEPEQNAALTPMASY